MTEMKKWQVRCEDGVTREMFLPECLEAVDQSEIPYYAAKWDFVNEWSRPDEVFNNFLDTCWQGDRALMEAWIAGKHTRENS